MIHTFTHLKSLWWVLHDVFLVACCKINKQKGSNAANFPRNKVQRGERRTKGRTLYIKQFKRRACVLRIDKV